MANVAKLVTNTVTELDYWIPTIWSRQVYEEAKTKMYWNRFSGPEGSGMPIIQKNELLTEPGETINISRIANLSDAGVSGSTTLRGTEEQFSLAQVTVTPEWYRHAVAADGKAQKQINQDFKMKADAGLSYWMAKKMDASMWTNARQTGAVGFDAATITIVYGNDATSLDDLDSADTMGVTEIAKASATLRANDIEPVSIAGMPAGLGYYLLFIHPHQAYSLKQDTDWIDRHSNAGVRGETNPLFTGALGEIDGVIVHETTQCSKADNANSPVISTARAVMVGQEALCRGMNLDVSIVAQIDDYEFIQGIGISAAWDDEVLASKAIVHILTAAIAPA